MKSISNIITSFLAVFLLGTICMRAQTVDLQVELVQNNGTYLDVKMQLRGSVAFPLYTSNFVITYTGDLGNGAIGAAPVLLTPHNFYGGQYGTATNWFSLPIAGRVSINPVLMGIQTNANVLTSWTDIATIRFTVLNPAGSANISWRTTGSGRTYAFKSDNPGNTLLNYGTTIVNLDVNPLPIELLSFTAHRTGNDIRLNWITSSELNSYGYEVERINPAKSWEKIGFVGGKGTTTVRQEYGYTDMTGSLTTIGEALRYRLKMIDLDGSSRYSHEVIVHYGNIPGMPILHATYPNPMREQGTVHFSLDRVETVSLELYDVVGKEIIKLVDNEQLDGGYHSRMLDIAKLPSGTYKVRLTTGKSTVNETIIINK